MGNEAQSNDLPKVAVYLGQSWGLVINLCAI